MARKPTRRLASIVFPKQGRPYVREEHLPPDQASQELVIARKFAGALRHFQGVRCSEPQAAAEPCDVMFDAGEGKRVGVQVVEVIDQDMRLLRSMREGYTNWLDREHSTVVQRFAGCSVNLVDSGDPPYLPPICTDAGKKCAAELAVFLDSVAAAIESLAVGKTRCRRTVVGPHARPVSLICDRRVSPEQGGRVALRWSGSGPVKRGHPPRGLLRLTVQAKVDKNYSKPAFEFWLLVFSPDYPVEPDDPEIGACRDLLESRAHPFDAAWYLFPYPKDNVGHLFKIWPST